MKKVILYIQNHQTQISALFLFLLSVAIVVYLNPREAKFKYEFRKGKPWLHENLVAPFDFNIYKTEEALAKERQQKRESKTIFLKYRKAVLPQALDNFEGSWLNYWSDSLARKKYGDQDWWSELSPSTWRDSALSAGKNALRDVLKRGILQPSDDPLLNRYGEVLITRDGVSEPTELDVYLSLQSAARQVEKQLEKKLPDFLARSVKSQAVAELQNNVVFDEKTTEKYLQTQLDEILPTRGAVQKGELIIFRGNLVDEEKYSKLNSLKRVYEGSLSGNRSYYYLLAGQILLIGILFLVLFLYLYQFKNLITEDIGRLTFILVNILLMVLAARLVLTFGNNYIYLVPFAVLPMVLRSFFDTRTALFTHIVAILIIGFLVPNSFEFIFLQFVAGIFAVLRVNNLYKRSQLFLTAVKITLVYCISYFSLAIVQEGRLENIDYLNFGFFVGNGLLTLVTYPLIYIQEKLFGFISEVTLLELSDTNNQLLRKLGQQAPGTFQHSLQVANLAEAAVNAINGNALLVRTGALYHDIGKMTAPMYFIENQSTGINPHDELSFEESAEIIIDHVPQGIKMAKKYNLPDELIDFIRTHHGTTTVMYFYRQYIKNFPEQKGALEKFTYPGPKPFSKETAVLMMADTVEAAGRSIENPDHEKIDELVEKLIDHQIDADQFENAPITLKEIREVKKIFKKMLMNIYHVRIQYPD